MYTEYILVIASFCISSEASSKPHILFILADDLGHNDIGYNAKLHGSAIRTPFLDKLASQGVILDNYYVQPICTPSRSQLLSGRYDIHTGMQHDVILAGSRNALPLDNKLLPEQLQNCGYDTHMVGKWHLGYFKSEYLPNKRGFNSFFGMLNGASDHYTHTVCRRRFCGVDMRSSATGPDNSTWGEYSAFTYTEKAIEVIDNRNTSKSLFLYLAYQNVHAPLQVPPKYIAPYRSIKSKKRRLYAAMVGVLDEAVKNVTTHLEKVGLLDDTIIIFSTDNGGHIVFGGNNWPYRGEKNTLWEGGVKGVAFLHGKRLGVSNVTRNNLMHISDWFPTLLSATNCVKLNNTQPLDGFDQWNAIKRKEVVPRTELLINIDPMNVARTTGSPIINGFDTRVQAALRFGPWKLLTGNPGFSKWVKPPEFRHESEEGTISDVHAMQNNLLKLYHIDSDPYETKNLVDEFPDIVQNLLRKLSSYNKTAVPPRFPPQDPRSNPNLHGGYWVPWLDRSSVIERESSIGS